MESEISSSVVLLFLKHTNVSQNTNLGHFWPTSSYVAYGMRLTVHPCVLHLCHSPGSHGGSCLVFHSGHPPYLGTHLIYEYHVDISWISMPLCGFHSMTWDANKLACNATCCIYVVSMHCHSHRCLFCCDCHSPPLPTAAAGVVTLLPPLLLTPTCAPHAMIVKVDDPPVNIAYFIGGCVVVILIAPDNDNVSVPREDGITKVRCCAVAAVTTAACHQQRHCPHHCHRLCCHHCVNVWLLMEGIQPCEWRGNGHQWLGNQVFRLAEEERKWDLWKRSPKIFWGI